VFPILVAATAHDIKEQHAPLSRIDHIFDGRGDKPGHRATRQRYVFHQHASLEFIQGALQAPTLI
jgi:hypothetical protein